MSLAVFTRRLAAAMPVLCRSMLRAEESFLAAESLTPAQYGVLHWLGERDQATMHELADALGLKASTATMVVDRLVEAGWVRREPSQVDRRSVLVAATGSGREVQAKTMAERVKGLKRTFEPLTPEERADYLRLIETLAERLEAQAVRKR
ncbi:MAG TPA: MarR family transcriptional regulator [Kiritimatiellia bacterium]|nr:MarR family transcriptional regulator [Kiritimatiellia bacterium]